MPSQHEQYVQLVDSLGIEFFLRGDAHDVEQGLRNALRAHDLTKVKNKLASERWQLLEEQMSAEKPEIAGELKRRVIQHAKPHRYKLWIKIASILPTSEKELLHLAGRGLATPYIRSLPKCKRLPKRLLKPSTLDCLVTNAPDKTNRIIELLRAGVFHSEALKRLITNAIEKRDFVELKTLLAFWPPSEKFPSLYVPDLAVAQVLPPEVVDASVWARVYYENGNETKAASYLKELEYYQRGSLGELGINQCNYGWIKRCCNTPASQATVLITVFERFRSASKSKPYGKPAMSADHYRSVAMQLLHWWTGLFTSKAERDGIIRHIIACADDKLTTLVLEQLKQQKPGFAAKNKSFLVEIWNELGQHQPGNLIDLLRIFPEAHGTANWQKAWPVKKGKYLKQLILAAKAFDANEANLLLLQMGADQECIEHILRETQNITFSLSDLLDAPLRLVRASVKSNLVSPELRFQWPCKSSASRIKLLLGKRSPVFEQASRICAEEHSYHEDIKDILLVIAGHEVPFNRLFRSCAIDLGYLSDTEFVKRQHLAVLAMKGKMHKCTPTQISKALSTVLQELAVQEILRRWPTLKKTPLRVQETIIFSKRSSLFFDRACAKDVARLFVGLKDKGELIYHIAELGHWELLTQFCRQYPTFLKHKTDKFCPFGAKPDVASKIIDLGFRITIHHSDENLISRHIKEKLWSDRELNQLLVNSIDQENSHVVAEIIPLEANQSGNIYDLFRQGHLAVKPFNFITVNRPLNQNIAAIQKILAELQLKAPSSKRVCALTYAATESRWELITGNQALTFKLRAESPYGFSLQGFKGIIGAAYHEALRTKTDFNQTILPSYRLSVAFGNLDEVLKIIRKRNLPAKAPLHDFGQFNLPRHGVWDIGAWRKLLAHHSGKGLNILHLAPRIEAQLGRPPLTLEEAEQTAVQCIYAQAAKFPELATLCHTYKRSEEQFEDYVRLLARAKKKDHCPDVKVTMPDSVYAIERLQPGDPKGPLLGVITNCCQHLHGHADECARAGFTHPDASFYVVKRQGRIIAQSFAWRTKTSLVFDSFETLSSDYDNLCLPCLKAVAAKALELDETLQDVRLGTGGGTPSLDLPEAKPVKWVQELTGMDSDSQYLLLQRNQEKEIAQTSGKE